MKKPKVSVIIPVFNEEKYILDCITSILKQTLKPKEIIIVNDGSTDDTLKITKKIKSKNLKIYSLKHQGPALARNFGAKAANGDILVFLDGDMKFDKKYLENLVKPIQSKKAQATFTKNEFVANSNNIWSRCWSINNYLPENLHIDKKMKDEANNFQAKKKKTFFKTKGYLNIGYGEDVTVLSQLNGLKAKAAKNAICHHFNPSSINEVFKSASWIGRGTVLKSFFSTLFVHSLPNSLRRGLTESIRHKQPFFIFFKIIFDAGILYGIFGKFFFGKHAK